MILELEDGLVLGPAGIVEAGHLGVEERLVVRGVDGEELKREREEKRG